MKEKIDEGLTFSIPLSERTFGFGQLILRQEPIFYVVAYDFQSESPRIEEAQELRPILLGNFFDVLIRNGRWQPIGQSPVPHVVFPCFKIKIGDKFYVESWNRRRKREATPNDLDALEYRTNYSPVILENALKAHFGIIPWEPMFNALKVERVTSLSEMC